MHNAQQASPLQRITRLHDLEPDEETLVIAIPRKCLMPVVDVLQECEIDKTTYDGMTLTDILDIIWYFGV